MAYPIPFPDYPYGVEEYVRKAEAAGVATPLFSQIMRLREDCLSREFKNQFITFYCGVYPDFPRQLQGAEGYVERERPAVGSLQMAESQAVPSVNDERDAETDDDTRADIARVREEAALLGFALVPLSQASKCTISGGRKSRRRSHRKSNRKSNRRSNRSRR